MKGKWVNGIAPRNFCWIVPGRLAIAERPGGSTAVHRAVRRHEEVLWLQHHGVRRLISILPDSVQTADYRAEGFAVANYPMRSHHTHSDVLEACYRDLEHSLATGVPTLLHGDDVSDRLLGVLAGYLIWTGVVPQVPIAIAQVERLVQRSIGPDGREVLQHLPVKS